MNEKVSKLPGRDEFKNILSRSHGYCNNSRLRQKNHKFQTRLGCTLRLYHLINLLILETEKLFSSNCISFVDKNGKIL